MQQPGGGSQYGVVTSEMSPFSSPGAGPRSHVLSIGPLQQQPPSTQPLTPENASPFISRVPPPPMSNSASNRPHPQASAFDDLAPAVVGGIPDNDALAEAAGEEAERGGNAGGNRWPRPETLALLKIRSEMDAAFRDATLKGPLWEDVSRKLAELGYKRSAKKCKEKFENVHKYYKRTKDGRAGRQDGKSYRFFSQLEALHGGGVGGRGASTPNASALPPLPEASPAPISFSAAMSVGPSGTRIQPSPISSVAPPPMASAPSRLLTELNPVNGPHRISGSAVTAAAIAGLSYSTNSSSSSSSEESDDEVTEDVGGGQKGRKRKRSSGGSDRSKSCDKMLVFFEQLMKQVMERQEAMQQRFLETIEKREQERMIREEAWRRQEMARLSREQEVLAQERTMAASRDNALISYLQKVTGQTIPILPAPVSAVFAASVAPQATTFVPPPLQPEQQPRQRPQPPQQKQHEKAAPKPVQLPQHQPPAPLPDPRHSAEIIGHQPSATELVEGSDAQVTGGASVSFETSMISPSRWPKAEVHALINLRSELDSRYQEAGPKGPLWEEISAGMQRLGYNRNAKRCKEKWENINKYFKKVKESNKKRPEDAKTCPYFHQLDVLYRKKHVTATGSSGVLRQQEQGTDFYPERTDATAPSQTTEQSHLSPAVAEKNGDNNCGNSDSIEGSGSVQNANGALPSGYFEEGMKKPEDTVKKLMEQRSQQNEMDDYDDSDNMKQDDDDDDDDDGGDDEERTMQYTIHEYQRPQVNGSNGGGGKASTTSTAAAATAGSFVAMVQ